MAKSIRSKWKRKCRAVKRVRYGQKELERLKKTLGITEKQGGTESINTPEVLEIANVTTGKEIKDRSSDKDVMDVDAIKKEFNAKTLRDKNGAYPIWLHPRKIKKVSKKAKKKRAGKQKKN